MVYDMILCYCCKSKVKALPAAVAEASRLMAIKRYRLSEIKSTDSNLKSNVLFEEDVKRSMPAVMQKSRGW